MEDRVKPFASLMEADTFSTEWTTVDDVMEKNRLWLQTKLDEGYDVLDIGIDPNREERSIFYQMEKDTVGGFFGQ
jgi:hypothetical protein